MLVLCNTYTQNTHTLSHTHKHTYTHSIIHTEIMLGETSLEIISHVVEEEVYYLNRHVDVVNRCSQGVKQFTES